MVSKLLKALCAATVALSATPTFADSSSNSFGQPLSQTQNSGGQFSELQGTETYVPSIWIDPDGCEHWAFDDGAEGYMSPHRNRDGSPVCRRQEVCGVIPSDTLFSTDKAIVASQALQRLEGFFSSGNARAYLIYGHTDERASDSYNMDLSQRRANAVANIARAVGANVVEARGFGERRPIAVGNSAQAYQKNRRVEITCLK